VEVVDRVGWYAVSVLGDHEHAPYTYTVGLGRVGHPELVIAGLAPAAAYAEIAELAELVLDGESLEDVDELDKPCGCAYRFVPVRYGALDLHVAEDFDEDYDGALQCVWSVGGRYPGEASYPEIACRQPLYGRSSWV
jgi:hypothetical protein